MNLHFRNKQAISIYTKEIIRKNLLLFDWNIKVVLHWHNLLCFSICIWLSTTLIANAYTFFVELSALAGGPTVSDIVHYALWSDTPSHPKGEAVKLKIRDKQWIFFVVFSLEICGNRGEIISEFLNAKRGSLQNLTCPVSKMYCCCTTRQTLTSNCS